MPNAFELREARFQANPKLIGICTALVGLRLMWTPARSVPPPVEAVTATLNDIASGEGIRPTCWPSSVAGVD